MIRRIIRFTLTAALLAAPVLAAPPKPLPGEELTNSSYLNYMVKNAVTEQEKMELSASAKDSADSSKLFLTWNAPSMADQIAADTGMIKLGMGAVFVPRMSEPGAIEPDILIKDKKGKVLRSGQTGRKFTLLPGMYTLHIGNLAEFPITREVCVEEGKITPVMPDWCALRVEVVDKNAMPIRGEYDLASLDPLTPIGRGRGRDIDLAEDLKIWFLPVGTYKIMGVGASLNSISNFLTARLSTPGEYVRFTVVQDTDDGKILGGGILLEDLEGRKNRVWTHNINVGGSMDFNYTKDRNRDSTTNYTGLTMLVYDRISMKKNKVEISNLIKMDVSLSVEKFLLRTLKSSVDELRIATLMTYRLFPRFGPYGRGEYVSGILPKTAKAPAGEVKGAEAPTHTFIYMDSLPKIVSDSTPYRTDDRSTSVVTSPMISPLHLQTGVGGNLQVIRNRAANMRFLSGFGLDYEIKWDSWSQTADKDMKFDSSSQIFQKYYSGKELHTTLVKSDKQRFEYGPEFMLNTNLYLTRFVSAESDIRLFMPLTRFVTPDLVMRNLLSFHLTGNVIIDYDHTYSLIQAESKELKANESRHRLLLRLSFSR